MHWRILNALRQEGHSATCARAHTMIRLDLRIELNYDIDAFGADFILNIHPALTSQQRVLNENLWLSQPLAPLLQTDRHTGNRLLRLRAGPGSLKLVYTALVEIDHHSVLPTQLPEVPVAQLPPEVLGYIYPSRYCQSDRLGRLANQAFGTMWQGHGRVLAVLQWVQRHVTFTSNTTNGNTSAVDTLIEQVGVCRDFAHLMIALLRALNIPARIATGTDYGADPALGPPDFHAYVEVYLGGRWYIFDPSGTGIPMGFVRIGTGRDAADVAFATIFGGVKTQAPVISAVPVAGSPTPIHSAYALSTDAGVTAG